MRIVRELTTNIQNILRNNPKKHNLKIPMHERKLGLVS